MTVAATHTHPPAPATPLSEAQALALAGTTDTAALVARAGALRDAGHGDLVTYSRKVFIPLTQLCRDVCHYCTFARTPRRLDKPYLDIDEVLALCRRGAELGCQEALFTLGEKPELRYRAAREALADMGYATTLEYVAAVARRVLEETGLLPHINAGNMTAAEIEMLRPVSASMGIMLESVSPRLCEKGMPHYGSPDKDPVVRLETMDLAGRARVPFTTGILIGIGETRRERIEALLAIRRLHEEHGHIQPDLEELLWTLAVARLIFGPAMNIQAPPNLSPGVLPKLVAAGINDWGGVSPLTPDHVNPEAPWPHLETLARETEQAGKFLEQRLTLYPGYVTGGERWLDAAVLPHVLRQCDSDGFAKRDTWHSGANKPLPDLDLSLLRRRDDDASVSAEVRDIVSKCREQAPLEAAEVARLFRARGPEFTHVCRQADELRRQVNGDRVSYAVNRNINYTNVCYFKCRFCAFSKGRQHEHLRGRPYDISAEEIARRCREAWERGATEVCMQGGIHPDYTGQTYLDIVATVKQATPAMHVHAFSPLEIRQGAETLGLSLQEFLRRLKEAGLDTLPGTAAEILHDEVRQHICPDKLNSAEWLEVMAAAHAVGFNTTATIMFGHVDRPEHWATHLLAIRALQSRTRGFTEFVPLPYVHMEAPMYQRGQSRRGPSFREAMLMHAVPRLVFHGLIDNIQASWVKMGRAGALACLQAGANDLGGTLMNESITRAAGADHGQEWPVAGIEEALTELGREPWMRTTRYEPAPDERRQTALRAPTLLACDYQPAGRTGVSKKLVNLAPAEQALN